MGQDDQWHAKRGSLSGSDHPEVALGPKLHTCIVEDFPDPTIPLISKFRCKTSQSAIGIGQHLVVQPLRNREEVRGMANANVPVKSSLLLGMRLRHEGLHSANDLGRSSVMFRCPIERHRIPTARDLHSQGTPLRQTLWKQDGHAHTQRRVINCGHQRMHLRYRGIHHATAGPPVDAWLVALVDVSLEEPAPVASDDSG